MAKTAITETITECCHGGTGLIFPHPPINAGVCFSTRLLVAICNQLCWPIPPSPPGFRVHDALHVKGSKRCSTMQRITSCTLPCCNSRQATDNVHNGERLALMCWRNKRNRAELGCKKNMPAALLGKPVINAGYLLSPDVI